MQPSDGHRIAEPLICTSVPAAPKQRRRPSALSVLSRPVPLRKLGDILRQELGLEGGLNAVVEEACSLLKIPLEGSLVDRAHKCHDAIKLQAHASTRSPPAAEHLVPSDETSESMAAWLDLPGCTAMVHRRMLCRGVEWGFQYINFFGDWELDEAQPVLNGRPHYTHQTMYGGRAHLYHCLDHNYSALRWVIGAKAGDTSGWAFCESDEFSPHEIDTPWTSWDGFGWHSCSTFNFAAEGDASAGVGTENEAELERRFVGVDGELDTTLVGRDSGRSSARASSPLTPRQPSVAWSELHDPAQQPDARDAAQRAVSDAAAAQSVPHREHARPRTRPQRQPAPSRACAIS